MIDHRKVPKNTLQMGFRAGQINNEYLEASEWNWQIDPLGFRNVFK